MFNAWEALGNPWPLIVGLQDFVGIISGQVQSSPAFLFSSLYSVSLFRVMSINNNRCFQNIKV